MYKRLLLLSMVLTMAACDSPAPDRQQAPELLPAVEHEQRSARTLLAPGPRQEKRVFSIILHDRKEIELLFNRLEDEAVHLGSQGQLPKIALVLHGPEVEFFALKNYQQNHELVDLAAKLSAFEAIEVKACQTRMKKLGLVAHDMPAFIELVPYGPDEVERLVEEDYLRM